MKIASLLPSTTEIAFALGSKDEIVGVSHECDFPEEAKTKPILTKSRIYPFKRSDEIDKDVAEIAKSGLSVYDIDANKLKELQPDIILTQDQCEVCAVSLKDVEKAVDKSICNAKIISLKPETLSDILNDIKTIGIAINKEKEALNLIKNLNIRIDNIKNKIKNINNKPKVCCIEWLEPVIVSGNWVPELIEIAGGTNIISSPGKHSPKIELKRILEEQPAKIVIAPCGFRVYQTMNDINLLALKPEWRKLNAVKNNEVYVVDGNSYFNRPSHRIVDSLEVLASVIHPGLFNEKRDLALRLGEL
ncbi:cobalamin-binding protein [Candidatus Woesearchaeota archaeon]|nr:cobalamin-binding protein [Candidatus Woesearchaeota archaeon]MBI2130227.1 cobalamin-binding protein [Candidatus Woesearchaeota archaeon]